MLRRQAVHHRFIRQAVLSTKESSRESSDDVLRKSEAWLRTRAAALKAEGNKLLEEAKRFLKLADAIKADEQRGLPSRSKTRSLFPMESTPAGEESPQWRGRRPTTKHPFPTTLRARKSNTKRWAQQHEIPYSSVKSWFAEPGSEAARAIPRRYAELIEHEFGLPATIAIWKNGITD